MSTNHRLLIIKDMNKHHVEVVCDGSVYRVAMRFGKPRMIFDISNRRYVMVPRGFDLIGILNYGIFKLLLEGIMGKNEDEKHVYIVTTTPENGKLNWHADCLDYVEYIYGYAIKYDKKTDVYYIIADMELDILECRNDDGVVATLQPDFDGSIQLDD